MELGTHNSMTYLKPKKWYLYPFQFIARCQSLSIEEQYNKGIRLFDIRISYDKNHNPEFRHGLIAYKRDVWNTLHWLNKQGEAIKIRIILEEGKPNAINEISFVKDIRNFQIAFNNLIFFEGRRKFDWKQLIELPSLSVIQLISSMQDSKMWPKLYAKTYNKENYKKYFTSDNIILLDFIEIQ